MIRRVQGFASSTEARQFEWMWQHPLKSLKAKAAIKAGVKRAGRRGSMTRKLAELTVLFALCPHLNLY
jgi:hypothetical protein